VLTARGVNSSLLSGCWRRLCRVEMVFIQFAVSPSVSRLGLATPWNGYPGNNNSFLMVGQDYVTGVNNIQYTAQFG
jgi:hypothetical protein